MILNGSGSDKSKKFRIRFTIRIQHIATVPDNTGGQKVVSYLKSFFSGWVPRHFSCPEKSSPAGGRENIEKLLSELTRILYLHVRSLFYIIL
jgi:hypothetical protein